MRGKWYNSVPDRESARDLAVNSPIGRYVMAKRCAICGKEPQYGHHVSHAKNRVNRRFEPNLQMGRVTVAGRSVRARVCTRCLRTYAA
jgi:large subunit ribosomal protein L28